MTRAAIDVPGVDPGAPDLAAARSLRQRLFGGTIPLWRLLAIFAATAGVLPATRPLADPDVWWHVRLGDLIRHSGLPHRELWSYPIVGRAWHPTSWLTDVLFSVLHEAGGWRALVLFKVLASAGILVLLYRQVTSRGRAEITAPIFVIALASIAIFFGERPQLLTFLLVLTVSPWARELATTGRWRAWHWVAITYLWCNLHGLWVLGPALLGLAAISWTVQQGFSRASLRTLLRAAGIAVLATLTTMATPVGPGLMIQPLAVAAIAPEMSEWEPTSLLGNAPFGYTLLLLVLLVSWVVVRPRQMGTFVFSMGVIAFSFWAVRNVASATLLLAPITAEAAVAAFAPRLGARPPSTAPRWFGVVAGGLVATSVLVIAFARPAVNPTIPWRIVHELQSLPQPKHVVADLAVSGLLTGEAPSASVAMDTRVDNYPKSYAHSYLGMLQMGPGWRRTFAKADPDYVVLLSQSGLCDYLQHDRHWVVLTHDNGFVLLRPPS